MKILPGSTIKIADRLPARRGVVMETRRQDRPKSMTVAYSLLRPDVRLSTARFVKPCARGPPSRA
jgi:hypothetical protein